MTALDLHPEQLLDKAANGSLSDSERTWLDQHLAQCAVCRFDQQARADFAAAPGAAQLDVDQLVTRALAGMPPKTQRPFATRAVRRSIGTFAAAALALSAMASFAAVAQLTGVLPRWIEAISTPVTPVVPAPPRPTLSVRRDDPVPPAPVEEQPVELEVEPPPAPIAIAPPAPRKIAPPVLREDLSPLTPPPAVMAPPDAGSLFHEANQARVRGERDEAVKLYRDLLFRFPAAPEARLSQATLGRLLLDTGDSAGALVELDGYLRGGELTLREEVLSARAVALGRLGRGAEEAAAWRALLDSYPQTIHAGRAHSRLEELTGH